MQMGALAARQEQLEELAPIRAALAAAVRMLRGAQKGAIAAEPHLGAAAAVAAAQAGLEITLMELPAEPADWESAPIMGMAAVAAAAAG